MMQPAHEGAEQDLRLDEANAVVGMIGRRGIVDGEEHARDCLKQKQKQRDRTEDVNPTCSARDRLFEERPFDRLEIEPAVEPLIKT